VDYKLSLIVTDCVRYVNKSECDVFSMYKCEDHLDSLGDKDAPARSIFTASNM